MHGDAQRSIEKFFAKLLPRKVCRFCKKGIQRSPIDAGFGSADDSPLVESNFEPRPNSEPVRPSFANGASTSKLHGAPRPNRPVYSCSWLRCYVDLAYPKAGRVEGYKARCKCRIKWPASAAVESPLSGANRKTCAHSDAYRVLNQMQTSASTPLGRRPTFPRNLVVWAGILLTRSAVTLVRPILRFLIAQSTCSVVQHQIR